MSDVPIHVSNLTSQQNERNDRDSTLNISGKESALSIKGERDAGNKELNVTFYQKLYNEVYNKDS
jgi:hypothetical protein